MLKPLIPVGSCVAAVAHADGARTDTTPAKPGIDRAASFTILVKDQDEALRWYTEKLGFEQRADQGKASEGFRWLTVGPRAQPDLEFELVLARADQTAQIGKQTTIVLAATDCKAVTAELQSHGVVFAGGVAEMPWGIASNFTDLYGNPYHLLQKAKR